jgi:CheY-like chemotaxis protein
MAETTRQDVCILVAEDDEGHFSLVKKNLQRAGIANDILRFADGEAILDFLFCRGSQPHREHGNAYLLMLDIRMPKVDGIEVLRAIKGDPDLRKMPVIMLTTTDDPSEVDRCHQIGCSVYVVKPVDYDDFIDAIGKVGLFLSIVRLPILNGQK